MCVTQLFSHAKWTGTPIGLSGNLLGMYSPNQMALVIIDFLSLLFFLCPQQMMRHIIIVTYVKWNNIIKHYLWFLGSFWSEFLSLWKLWDILCFVWLSWLTVWNITKTQLTSWSGGNSIGALNLINTTISKWTTLVNYLTRNQFYIHYELKLQKNKSLASKL